MDDNKKEKIRIKGKVQDVLQGGNFNVKLENGFDVIASVSGKMRLHHIQILKGDMVEIELSSYDLTHGRIVYRVS
ncbi:MAG: translation initiation factor IF-1 [Mycoplasmoidaceae bacterium]